MLSLLVHDIFFIINNHNIYNFIVQCYQYMDTAHLNY